MAEQIGKNKAPFSVEDLGIALYSDEDVFGESDSWKYYRGQVKAAVGVETDSRKIERGNLFVALRGEKFDGHEFLQKAADGGAFGAVVDDRYWQEHQEKSDLPLIRVEDTLTSLGALARFHRRQFDSVEANTRLPVVAVTGSYGKTSTRALIHAALGAGGETLTSQANFNNEIGLPMTLFQLEKEHQFAVLEMGMRGVGQIDYLAKIAEPSVGVITNIGPQHIELLGNLENIARAKAELIENLPADGLAVLPADSPFLPMIKGKSPCRVVTFGLAKDADYRVENIRGDDENFLYFDLHFDGFVQRRIALPMIGAHNAVNAAAALAVAHQLGIEITDAERYLESAQLPGARMRVVKAQRGVTIIDDCYNAGPDSMRAALQTLRDFPGNGRRVAVLGAMRELGDYSDDEHRKLGALASEICHFIVGVGPETEPMMDAIRESGNCQLFGWSADADGAIPIVLSRLQAGDMVLVKGSRSVGLEVVVEAFQAIE